MSRGSLVRKLLTIPARLFAILFVMFLIIQLAPSGPVDRLLTSVYEWSVYDGIPPSGVRRKYFPILRTRHWACVDAPG
jgi:ABC-type microcin C transport system permease subunit YejB